MSKKIVGYRCDTCKKFTEGTTGEAIPWNCPVCGKETCSECYSFCGVCNSCAENLTTEQCREAAIKMGFRFDD